MPTPDFDPIDSLRQVMREERMQWWWRDLTVFPFESYYRLVGKQELLGLPQYTMFMRHDPQTQTNVGVHQLLREADDSLSASRWAVGFITYQGAPLPFPWKPDEELLSLPDDSRGIIPASDLPDDAVYAVLRDEARVGICGHAAFVTTPHGRMRASAPSERFTGQPLMFPVTHFLHELTPLPFDERAKSEAERVAEMSTPYYQVFTKSNAAQIPDGSVVMRYNPKTQECSGLYLLFHEVLGDGERSGYYRIEGVRAQALFITPKAFRRPVETSFTWTPYESIPNPDDLLDFGQRVAYYSQYLHDVTHFAVLRPETMGSLFAVAIRGYLDLAEYDPWTDQWRPSPTQTKEIT